MSDYADYLVIGGGRAAASAVEELVNEGHEGEIAIIGAETHLPYDRPPLSKGFLLGLDDRASLDIEDRDSYAQNGIELILGRRAVALDVRECAVDLDDGRRVRFDQLLIATGARLRKLELPGSHLTGIHYLRTVDDAQALRDAALASKRAVVVGSGFIGMEVASALSQMGLETTVLDKAHVLYGKFLSPELSAFFEALYAEHGVRILHGVGPVEFRGRDDVESVLTGAGESLPCDLVVIGVGVAPEVTFLEDSGLTLENGLVVDQYMRSSAQGIFGAGDVANFWDPVYGRRRRVEHWDTARQHGRIAARNMLGRQEPYDVISYFFSDTFDLSFDFIGDTEGCDQTIMRGSPASRSFAVFYLAQGMLRAAFLLGRPMEERTAAERLIKRRDDLTGAEARLGDPTVPVRELGSAT